MRGSSNEAAERAHVVEQIPDRILGSGWPAARPAEEPKYSWLRDQAGRGRSALQRQAELAEKLGDDAPDMDAAIRNPGMHTPCRAGGEEQLALEQLAAFSLLPRWVDEASVETT